jgi:uncharacterized membrane protein YfcA
MTVFVVIDAFIGSKIGGNILPRIDAGALRYYFSAIVIFLASVMLLKAGGVL